MDDQDKVSLDELVVLSKFDGEATPENEVERITVHNGQIIKVELIENGEVVSTETVKEVN